MTARKKKGKFGPIIILLLFLAFAFSQISGNREAKPADAQNVRAVPAVQMEVTAKSRGYRPCKVCSP